MKLRDLANPRWIYRGWYYFRLGYGTYLTFLLGYVSTFVTVYYLAIKNMPQLLDIFPHFLQFVALGTIIGVPLAVAIGWIHLKRSKLFSSELDVSYEANPYNYKLVPGYWKDVFVPAMLVQMRILKKLSETEGLLVDTERSEIEELEKKMMILVEGGYVGSPRRGHNF